MEALNIINQKSAVFDQAMISQDRKLKNKDNRKIDANKSESVPLRYVITSNIKPKSKL